MEHLIARVRSIRGTEVSKLKKVLSDKTIYRLDDDLTSFIPYDPDHNLDPGTWFGIEKFSDKPYFLDWLGRPFVSSDYDQLSASEGKQIDYICAYQEGNTYCFQKIVKSNYLSKRMFISIGDEFSLEPDKTFLIVNENPDAIYLKNQDVLLFRSLPTITSIFKGIDTLYREATEGETAQFLCNSFITLRDGFSAQKVSKPNRHRISLAIESMEKFDGKQQQEVVAYIQGYCPTLSYQNGVFSIGTDNELKLLLYGIEQRNYTTIITKEKRLANSILTIA